MATRSTRIQSLCPLLIVALAATVISASESALPKFKYKTGVWEITDGKLRCDPARQWNIALADRKAPADVSVETEFTVHDSGVVVSGHSGMGRFATMGADLFGENDLWADAALYLCYRDGEDGALPDYYRIEVSAHADAGHIALWKMGGGYVAVKPVAAAEKKSHRLRAELDKDGSIRVALNGEELLRYRDPWPLKPGKAGVGALKGLVEFSAFTVAPLARDITVGAQPANFQLRKWYNSTALEENWVFDGDEPVFRVNTKDLYAFEWMKLRPGMLPPLCFNHWFWTQWTGEDTELGTPDGFEVLKQGNTFECVMKVKPKKTAGATGKFHVTVTRDDAARRYIYAVDTSMTVSKDAPLPYRHPVEFFDPWPSACKGRMIDTERVPRQRYDAIAWEQPGGKVPRRVNFSNDYINFGGDQTNYTANSTVKPLGKAVMGYENDVNLVIQYVRDPGYPLVTEMCAWGYDWHNRIVNEAWRKTGIPPGTELSLKFNLTHEDAGALKPLFDESKHIHEEACANTERPLFEWPVSTMAKTAQPLASRNTLVWNGGEYVTNKGKGDKFSLRLLPKQKLSAHFGLSHFLPKHFYSAWQTTMSFDALVEGGTGKLDVACNTTSPRTLSNKQSFTLEAGKKSAWQTFTMPADAYIGGANCDVVFVNSGDAPIFIDNIRFPEPPTVKKPQWEIQAELLNVALMVPDKDAVNGFAAGITPDNLKPNDCFYGPYDDELPAGEYLAVIRLKVADNSSKENLVGWDFCQSEGAKNYVPAQGNWKGTDFPAANTYVDKEVSFKREAGGRLSVRLYQRQATGRFWVDKVTLRRVKDGWGNPLPDKRDRW